MNADLRTAIRSAQQAWARQSITARLAVVRRVRHLIAQHGQTFAEHIRQVRQSSLHEAFAGEVLPTAEACRFLEMNAKRILRPQHLRSGLRWLGRVSTTIAREPFGLILVLGPRNYPLFLPGVQTLQALVAGNAVLLKPAVGCRPITELFAALFDKAGLDRHVLTILDEAPSHATEAIALGVDKVVLTGHAHTGQQVLRELAPHVVPATMELSGCDASFVLPGADLQRAARALAFGLRWNHSATCIAPRRVFVVRDCVAGLEQALVAMLGEHPTRPIPAFTAEQRALVQDALAHGATLVFGQADSPPVILSHVPVAARLRREEIFAPLLSIIPVNDQEDALTQSAECPYRLGATIFGPDSVAWEWAQRIDAGCITINDAIVPTADPRFPFGGRGRSGFGVTRGAEGLRQMTTIKAIAVQRGHTRHLDDADFADHELLRLYLEATHGPSWWNRLKTWGRLLRHLGQRRTTRKDKQT